MKLPRSGNLRLFSLLCACCVLIPVAFGIAVAMRAPAPTARDQRAVPPHTLAPQAIAEPGLPAAPDSLASIQTAAAKIASPPARKDHLLYFRTNAMGDKYGKLTAVPLNALNQPALDQIRYASDLDCDRVHFAAGHGVCLTSDRGVFTTYSAVLFDGQMRPGVRLPLNGIPSRARVSPSGHLAAMTVFLAGQSYAALSFSTQTTILDTVRGEVLIPDLETLSVSRDGAPFRSPDFNFWGVTFAHDENRFFATLWSRGKAYLIEGDLANRTARVIYNDVECPSLSPDNTRIAFKRRRGSSGADWHIYILDLKTLTERASGEVRSVDDQMEWLDNEHVLYALSRSENGSGASTDIWVVPVAPGGTPHQLLRGAFSPAADQ